MPGSSLPEPCITAVRPPWAVRGGRLSISGESFPINGPRLPEVRIGGVPARVVRASATDLDVLVSAEVEGGRQPIRIEGLAGATAFVDIGVPIATGLHQVDSPVFASDGTLYVTYSGSRDQQAPISIYRIPRGGVAEPFASVANPTSLAVDRYDRVYVSSRFEGTVYRLDPDGTAVAVASELGVPCGLAVDDEDMLFVGDRAGTVFRVSPSRHVEAFASLPASVAAFHLALGPDGHLYVTAPTLSPRDVVYRVDPDGRVEATGSAFGRPQGLAFDAQGQLFVVEALAGASGVYRARQGERRELAVAGAHLVGVALDPTGGLVVASSDTIYRLDVPLRGVAREWASGALAGPPPS